MQIVGSEKFIEAFNKMFKENECRFIGFCDGKKIFVKN